MLATFSQSITNMQSTRPINPQNGLIRRSAGSNQPTHFRHQIQADKIQTDRVQTDGIQTDKVQTDRVKADSIQTG